VPVCSICGQENPDIARFCLACGAALGPQTVPRETRKTVTIVFADVIGSTSLGERLDPESIRRVMARYFEEMKAAVERHGGTVEKFIGDAVMAVFGIPTVHEDDALRAVRAAHEMRERLEALNDELDRDWGVALRSRIGVNTGEVMAGDPATGQTLVTGDAVNVAARLEQSAQPGEILIGGATQHLARDAAVFEPLDPLPLKGKGEPVDAFRLAELHPGTPAAARRLVSPMVGRARQHELLKAAWRSAVADRACHLFTVLGAAGVGKSRLAQEFLSSTLEATEVTVLEGRCLAYGEGITYWPVREIISAAAGIEDDDLPDAARARIETLIRDAAADADLLTSRIAQLLGLSPAAAPAEEIAWAVRKLLEALAARSPLVVVLEDTHWAEPTLLDLIDHVADLSRDAPILLLCMARPDLLDRRPSWGGGKLNATTIQLQPLDEQESERLVGNLLGRTGLEEDVLARIVASAEGNPLFVEEMLSMLIDDGHLIRKGEGWTPVGDIGIAALPPTIHALLATRLDQLDDEERRVLERASVMGQVFYRGALEALPAEAARETLDTVLEGLVRKDLIRPERSEEFAREQSYRFRHILIRDAAYEAIPKERRTQLHEAFAGWLEQAVGERVTEYEEILAYHLERAVRQRSELGPLDEHARTVGRRAADLLASAGRRAFDRNDLPASVNLLGRAGALLAADDPKRLNLLIDVGTALHESGELARADRVLVEAIDTTGRLGDDRLKAHAMLAHLYLRMFADPAFKVEEIQEGVAQAIPVFERDDDHRGLARAWRLLSWAHNNRLRQAERQEALERALEHARRAGDRPEETLCLYRLASPPLHGPMSVPEAKRFLERLNDREGGDRTVEAGVAFSMAWLEAMCGRFDEARELAGRAVAIQEDLGMRLEAAGTAAEAFGFVEVLAGDLPAAERNVRNGYEALERLGEKAYHSTQAAELALILCALGRFAEADLLTDVSEETAASEDALTHILWRRARAAILAHQGDLDRAQALAGEAVGLAEATDALNIRGFTLMDLAEVLRLSGRGGEAIPVVERAIALFDQKENVVSADRARRKLAELVAGGSGQ
jgi:predicted ATPase/class 3 adenylate cyclase